MRGEGPVLQYVRARVFRLVAARTRSYVCKVSVSEAATQIYKTLAK